MNECQVYLNPVESGPGDADMILMSIIMVLPLAALVLFYYLPLGTAVEIYIPVLIVAGYCYIVMFKTMRARAQTGLEAMIGREALAIEDIDAEGKILFNDEIWEATARGAKIAEGEQVKILDAEGLVLVVEGLHEDEKRSRPQTA